MKKIYYITAVFLSFNLMYSQKWEKVNGVTNSVGNQNAVNQTSQPLIAPNIIDPNNPIDPYPDPVVTTPTVVSTYHDTKGEISVSGSGELNYTLPIALPPGIKSVAPQMNLVYGSNSFTGIAGIGWNISGLSSITRIGKNIEKDGEIKGVKFNYSDLYQFNGQRLILTSGGYGQDGATYTTQQFSNIKIKSVGTSAETASPGPASFEVTFEDGSQAIYGGNINAYNNHEYSLTKWTDIYGNYITYNYVKENSVIRISTIQWGGNSVKSTAHFNTITFNFKARNIKMSAYTNGVRSIQDKILDNVIVSTNGSQFRKYIIEYATAPNGSNYEILSKITEYNAANEASNPVTFTRNTSNDGLYGVDKGNYTRGSLDNNTSVKGDFDGDGKLDILSFVPYTDTGYWTDDSMSCNGYCGDSQWVPGEIIPAHTELKVSGLDANYQVYNVSTSDLTKKALTATLLSSDGKTKQRQALINYKEGTDPLATRKLKFDTYFLNSSNQMALEYSKEIPSSLYDETYIEPHTGVFTEYVEIESYLKDVKEVDVNSDGVSELVLVVETTTTRHNTVDPNCGGGLLKKAGGTTSGTTMRPAPCTIDITDPPVYRYYLVNPNPSDTSLPYALNGTFSEDIFDKGRFTDVDGDGLQEISIIQNNNINVYGFTKNANNQYQFESKSSFWKILEGDREGAIFSDLNGDGKTDILIPYTNKNKIITAIPLTYEYRWNTYLSDGTKFLDKASSQQFGMYNPKNLNIGSTYMNKYEFYYAKDINRDGLSDFIKIKSWNWVPGWNDPGDSSYGIEIYENRGVNTDGTISYVQTFNTQPQDNDDCATCSVAEEPYQPMVGNFRIETQENFLIILHGSEMLKFSYYDVNERARLNSITQGKIKTDVQYSELDDRKSASFYSGSNTLQYPYTEIERLAQTKVVSKLIQGNTQQDFSYRGLISNAWGRGLMGFRKTARTNWYAQGTPIIWTGSEMNPLLDGLPIKQWTTKNYLDAFPSDFSSANTDLLTYKETGYLVQNFGQREVRLPNYTVEKDFLKDVTKTTTVDYDTTYYLPVKNTVNVNNGFATTISNLDYYHNPAGIGSSYYIGRPRSKTENISVPSYNDVKNSKEEYVYNGNNLQYARKYGNNTTDYIQEEYTYDGWGNVTQKVTSSSNASETVKYTEKTVYEALGRFVSEKYDNLNRKTSFIYNNLGLVTKETDFLGNTATNTYDNWGKLTQTVSSLSGTTTYQYTKYSDGSSTQIVNAPDGDIITSYYDVKGQNIKTKTKAFEQGKYVIVETQFDAVGRKTAVSEPYFDGGTASDWNTIQYDNLSRPIVNTVFNGRSSTTTYNGRTVKVVENTGKFIEKTTDPLGNIITSKDLGGTITFTYNAAGQQTKASYSGNNVVTTYDNWGRKISFNDPSNGLYQYEYSPLGLLKKETSPKGYKQYTYNTKGQMTNVVESATDGSTAKNYTISYNATTGLVTGKTGTSKTGSAGTAKTFSSTTVYDAKGRITSNSETFDGRTFTKNNITYDALNRIASYTQSAVSSGVTTSANIVNAFSTWKGDLYQVKQGTTNKVLWELQTTNAKGQVITAKLGATQISNTYAGDGFLTNAKHYSATAVLMDNDYQFTGWKNELNSRYNRVLGISEQFTYDSNNRLINWTNPRTGQMSNNTYDAQGRITYNDQIGTIQYNNAQSIYRPSGMTLNANGIANYDNQGTSTSTLIQNISYNENNDPVKIDGVKGDYAFEYGLSENRQIMYYGGNFTANSGAKFTKYYSEGGDAEVIRNNQTGQEKVVLYIGGTPYESNIVFMKNFAETSGSFKFLHKDYLGSIMAISDEAGNALERRHYDAWGIITHLKIGSSAVITDKNTIKITDWLIDRGYTSHEHLKEVELIHMNGRLYDPLLRRFLNADENIQDPYNTQIYNKYGYVTNNPLMFNDPSGELFGIDDLTIGGIILIGAIIGGVGYTLGVLISTGSLRQWNIFDFGKSVIIGGISSAVTFGIGDAFKSVKFLAELSKTSKLLVQAGMHGVSQGFFSMVGSENGSGFFQGFVSGALGSLGAKGWTAMVGENVAKNGGMIAFGALSGGIGAELSGGNFFKGFMIGGVVAGFNDLLHSDGPKPKISTWLRNYLNKSGLFSFTADYTKNGYVFENSFVGNSSTSWTTYQPDTFITNFGVGWASNIVLEGVGLSGRIGGFTGTAAGLLSPLSTQYKVDYTTFKQRVFYGKVTYNLITGDISNVKMSKIVTQNVNIVRTLYQRTLNNTLNLSTEGWKFQTFKQNTSVQSYNYGIPTIGGNVYGN